MLTVRLLGRVSVSRDGAPLTGLSSGPGLRLLTALILRAGERVARTELAFRLWPDSTEPQARTNLRKALHQLRQELDDVDQVVEITHGAVCWRADGPAHVDVAAFLAACERNLDELAVGHYGGALLPGVYDDWILVERDRLHGLATAALTRLIDASGADHAARLAFASRLLELEPTSESGHRQVIDAHRHRGDRASAVRAYHRCLEVLATELGVEPAAETRALYEQLIEREAAPEGPPGRPAPLIGRQPAWDVLENLWGRAGIDPVHLVIVAGEAGVGKSRLIADFARHCRAGGALVLYARSYETIDTAWGPVAMWLRDDELATALADAPGDLLSAVSRLAPQLRNRADVPVPAPVLDELARFQFYDSLVTALLYGNAPRLLVLDDLQWCDATTLGLVAHLLHTNPVAPVLVTGLLRPEDLDEDHPLAAVLDGLAVEGRVSVIELDRLSPQDTALVADAVAARPLGPADHARIWAESEGNPLFVVELMKADRPGAAPGAAAPTVRAVIERRLRRLGPDARRLAETAAIMGAEFTFEELAAVAGTGEEQLVSALDELWRRRIVAEVGARYDFTHDKLREVAAAGVSAPRRRQIHSDVADGLAAVHGADRVSGRVAPHLRAAGRPAEAIEAFRRSAAASLQLYDLDVAVSALRSALDLVPTLPVPVDAAAVEQELLIDLGAVLVAREGYGSAEVREVYDRATGLARMRGQLIEPAILRGLGLAAVVSCRFEEAERLGRDLTTALGDPIARTEGHYLLGVTAFWRGDLTGSARSLQLSLDSYAAERREIHQFRFAQDPYPVCLVRLALTRFWQGDEPVALALADQAAQWCAGTGHRHTTSYVLAYAGLLAAEHHDIARLEAVLEPGRPLWSEAPGFFAAFGPLYDGWCRVLGGTARGAADIDRALDEWRQSGQVLHLTHGLVLRARAALLAADLDAASLALQEAQHRTEATGQHYLLSEILRLAALTAAQQTGPESARASLDRAIQAAASIGAAGAELRARATRLDLLGEGRQETEALLARLGDRLTSPTRQEAERALHTRHR